MRKLPNYLRKYAQIHEYKVHQRRDPYRPPSSIHRETLPGDRDLLTDFEDTRAAEHNMEETPFKNSSQRYEEQTPGRIRPQDEEVSRQEYSVQKKKYSLGKRNSLSSTTLERANEVESFLKQRELQVLIIP